MEQHETNKKTKPLIRISKHERLTFRLIILEYTLKIPFLQPENKHR